MSNYRMNLKFVLTVIVIGFAFISNVFAQYNPPVLTAPANNSTCSDLSVRLAWDAPQFVSSYDVIVAEDDAFNAIILNTTNVTTAFLDINLTQNDKKLYWKTIAYFTGDTVTRHSAVWNFTTKKTAPSLLLPANNEFCVPISPKFQWAQVSGAASYTFEISKHQNFDTVFAVYNNITADTLRLVTLGYNTRYYWRMRTVNMNCMSDWSSISTFRTLSAPVLPVSPANGSIGIPLFAGQTSADYQVELKWRLSDIPASYTIEIDTLADFSTKMIDDVTADTMYTATLLQRNNSKYFWRVKAEFNNDSLNQCKTAWSTVYTFKTPYKAVTLTSPSNAEQCASLKSILKWQAVDTVKYYTVMVSKSASFSDTVVIATKINASQLALNLTQEKTEYFWRVRAEDNSNTGNWSDVYSFTTTILPPTAISPLDSATGVSFANKFEWSNLDWRAAYSIQISDTINFERILSEASNLDTNMYNYSFNKYNTQYYWRVKIAFEGCESAWSKAYLVKTVIAPPALNNPSDSAVITGVSPILEWSKVTAATTYEVQYDTSYAFLNPTGRIGLPSASIRFTDLLENTKYFWRVRATNTEGTSAWSKIFMFRTGYEVPSVPVLLAPVNGLTKSAVDSVKLVWAKSLKAVTYELIVTEENLISQKIIDTLNLTDTTFVIYDLKNYKNYKWKVRAKNLGGYSAWAAEYGFRTIALAPASTPALVTPMAGAENQQINIMMKWLEVTGADAYHIQVSKDSTFTKPADMFLDDDNVWILYKSLYNLDYNTKYFWRVRGWNEGGIGPWSTARWFVTKILVSVEEDAGQFSLNVYPNPASNSATFNFVLPESSDVKVTLFNSLGIEQAVINRTAMPQGTNIIDMNVAGLPSGSYIFVIDAAGKKFGGKLNIAR